MYPWSSSYMPHGARSLHARLLSSLLSLSLCSLEQKRGEGYDTILEALEPDSRFDSRSTCHAYHSCSLPWSNGRSTFARALTPWDRGERMDGRRVERSVEFDRDVAHGGAKLCKTLVLATILNFCPFLPSPQSLSPSWSSLDKIYHLTEPLPTCLSTGTKQRIGQHDRSCLVIRIRYFFQPFSLFTFFQLSSRVPFPENWLKRRRGTRLQSWNIGIGEWNLAIPSNPTEQPTYVFANHLSYKFDRMEYIPRVYGPRYRREYAPVDIGSKMSFRRVYTRYTTVYLEVTR